MRKRRPPKPVRTAEPGPTPGVDFGANFRADLAEGAAVFASVLAIYLMTLHPSVSGGDSGEFLAAACTLGVPHPPGYPLYTLLARAAASIPGLTVAWKVNALSALLNSFAAAFLYYAARRMSRSRWAALAATGIFAFSPLAWTYSTSAEVFALNNLFLAMLLCLFTQFVHAPRPRTACYLAFLLGLGLTNHHTLIFFGGPLAAAVLWIGRRELLAPRPFATLIGCFVAGLVPYIYLPWASSRTTEFGWGDQTTLEGFLRHVLRREYGTLSLVTPNQAMSGPGFVIAGYAKSLFAQHLWLGPLAAVVGLQASIKGPAATPPTRALAVWFLVSYLSYVLIFNALARVPLATEDWWLSLVSRMWILPNLALCAWIAPGLMALTSRLGPGPARTRALAAAAALALAAQIGLHFRQQDQRGNRTLERYSKAILEPLPRGAVVLANADHTYTSLIYFQKCEGLRPDVWIIPQGQLSAQWMWDLAPRRYPGLSIPGPYLGKTEGGYSWRDFLAANHLRFPIFAVSHLRDDGTAMEAFDFWPSGLALRVMAKGESPNLLAWGREASEGARRLDLSGLERFRDGLWEHLAWEDLWTARTRTATAFIGAGMHELAIQHFEELIRSHPNPPAEYYHDLGLAHSKVAERKRSPAHIDGAIANWTRYLQRIRPNDPNEPAVRRRLEEFQRAFNAAAP